MTTTDPNPGRPEGDAGRKGRPRRTEAIDAPITRARPAQKITTETKTTKTPVESRREEQSRLKREEADHAQSLFERRALLVAGLVLFVVIVVASGLALLLSNDPQVRGWATGSLTSLLTGFLAYLLGRQQAK
jgi:hypothetical protein